MFVLWRLVEEKVETRRALAAERSPEVVHFGFLGGLVLGAHFISLAGGWIAAGARSSLVFGLA